MNTRRELDERLLEEARSRNDGRTLRRFVLLLAAAFLLGSAGLSQGQPALGIGTAIVLVVVAVVTLRS